MTPEIGRWYRVTSGSQKGQSGCCDLVSSYAVGLRYRLTSDTAGYIGRFPADMLEPTSAPQHEPTVVGAPRQAALDMMVRRS
jgi:hypothetical protein